MAVETIGGAPSQVTASTTDSCVIRVITKETICYTGFGYTNIEQRHAYERKGLYTKH